MRLVHLALVFFMFGLFKANATPEQEFWKWFQKNEAMLFAFEKNQEAVFGSLGTQMNKVHESLTFEFGPVENGKREFVISADGIKDAFPAVERVYATAPKLDRWIFIKFRPRRVPMGVDYGGVKIKPDDLHFTIEPDKGKAGITIFIRGYNAERHNVYVGIAFLMLDQVLGEYDVETKVGFVETKSSSSPSELEKKPIEQAAKVFDDFWKFQEGNTNLVRPGSVLTNQ